ncbi:MAG: deoxyribonuclease IV [Acidimicrobiales bacterium]
MLLGAQVRQAGGLLRALARAEGMRAEAIQVFAQSPRQWRSPSHGDEVLAAFGDARRRSATVGISFCHAPYLVNLATPDPEMHARSCRCLTDNLAAAARMGAAGLVVHPGSHLGAGLETRLDGIAVALRTALDEVWSEGWRCPILLENTAGAGGAVGRSFDELARIIEGAGGDGRIGVCLDTQHLWASGVAFTTTEAADAVVEALHRSVGLERLACLHLNDSKVELGAGRDRHENLGQGAIGEAGLRALLGQPRLQGLPVILEVPGLAGAGPEAEDLAVARRLHTEALAARRAGDVGDRERREGGTCGR